ncbi:acetyl-CoA decarbonylase/synthase complex subunit gamma [Tepidibacter formicigenes]|jgi:acetyl-CoA decarbonylase/synthase complex subunit gamma|uniref:Acetyl-CoA decarbonylase/synthase complex subunit gamma n=1 Tax=Tepidibacter formicigenes DSM 15518 TaxID=1123349 RepID=A0A1M6KTH7_9FIRM|nr:acetyl-CoA decarbonylase/synthase complex subunit gamma [Tepidibacter formicigenes]SHJ62271.1 acetyl-CoA decarbonylase/synthase complex subunit gamma [Tepidibacter formicigenes DSM 15518]
MALKGLDIFKLTPKKNCKDCGFPTCMAFSMKVAAGAAKIEKCPHMSEDALAKLSEATAPPMKTLTIGKGDSEYKLGGETVLFRHEKTFVNRNRFAVVLSDSMNDEEINAKIENIKKVNYIRIGEEMKVEIVALKYEGNKDNYINLINKVKTSELKVAYMLICEDSAVLKEALELVKAENPIVYGATKENYKEMVELVKADKLALGVKASSLEELYGLVEDIHKLGHKELILNPGSSSVKEAFTNTVQIRRIALKEGDRTFGYPSVLFVNEIAKDDKFMEIALSSLFTVKYGSIIVINDIDYVRALPLFALRQNIYTDPQRPMRVEPKVYPINNPDENSPVLVTVDFALTYFIIAGEIERSKVPMWLAIPDAGGYSVLTAWAAGKFGGSSIANFIKESGVADKTKCRKLIIPGKVAVLKGDIEDNLPGWEVVIGTNESMELPKFLREFNEELRTAKA